MVHSDEQKLTKKKTNIHQTKENDDKIIHKIIYKNKTKTCATREKTFKSMNNKLKTYIKFKVTRVQN